MVVAMMIVALAMVASGITAIAFGADIIRFEQGWTALVAGVAATGGVLLFGLALVLGEFRHLSRALAAAGIGRPADQQAGDFFASARNALAEAEATPDEPGYPYAAETPEPPRAPASFVSPVAATERDAPEPGTRGRGGRFLGFGRRRNGSAPNAAAAAGDGRLAPVIPLPLRHEEPGRAGTTPPLVRGSDPPERYDSVFPDFSAREADAKFVFPIPPDAPAAPRGTGALPSGAGPAPELPGVTDAADEALVPVPVDVDRDEETPPGDGTAEPTIAGTYSSGGNLYVMYSDGSIAAETADGIFRFDSLDGLKDYIASSSAAAPAAENRETATAP